MTYLGYIANHIKPVLNGVPIKKIHVRPCKVVAKYGDAERCERLMNGDR